MTMNLHVGGVVLCGGMSHRMGQAKAWLPVGSETMLQRVVGIVRGVVDPVVVVGRREQSLPPLPDGTLLAHDLIDGLGPLAGLAAGFEALTERCDAVFVVACDQPLLRPDFIRRLIQLRADEPAVAVEHDGFVHALTAVYRLDTGAILEALLTKGERRAQRFFAQCGGQCVPAAALIDVDPALYSLQNANDAAAYERMLQQLRT